VIAYGHRIGLRASDASALERMTASLPPGWKEAARPEVDCLYSLVVGGAAGRVRRFHILYRGSAQLSRTHDLDSVFEALENDLKMHVAEASSRVFVHAGVVGWRGEAIVLPGRSYAGKSTLVAALVGAGATYYSDEFAVLDERGRVHPYARPLVLRPRRGETTSEAAGKRLTLQGGTKPLPVRLVALTHYKPGARWRPRPLSPGRALLALMESTVPARQRPEASLAALSAVVKRAAAIKGVRGEVEEAVEQLLRPEWRAR